MRTNSGMAGMQSSGVGSIYRTRAPGLRNNSSSKVKSSAFNGIDGRTLRFFSPETERAFADSYGKHMDNNYFWLSVAMFCLSIFSEGTYVIFDPLFSNPAVHSYTMGGVGAFFITTGWSLVNMVVIKCGYMQRARPFTREMIVVSFILYLHVCIIAVNPHYWAACHGQTTIDMYGDANVSFSHTDSSVVLGMVAITSVVHTMPIRWHSLAITEVSAVALYMVCWMALGSPEAFNANYNFILVFVSILAQGVGKRASEYHARISFVHYLHEKSLRFQSECQLQTLEHIVSPAVPENEKAGSEAPESLANTDKIFADLRADDTQETSLENIASIGRREHWLIDESDLPILWPQQTLGAGSFGVVAAAELHDTPVAVKMPKESATKRNPRFLAQLGNELRVLRHVRHPNIVMFHGAVVNFEHCELALVLELVCGPQLGQVVLQKEGWWAPIDDKIRFQLVQGVSRALRYLHALSPVIVHGDLKDSNILVEGVRTGVKPKLLDFGLSRLLSVGARPLGGTLVWSAPELLNDSLRPPDRSADVFSFGRLMYLIVTSRRPLVDCTKKQVLAMAKDGSFPTLDWSTGGSLVPFAKGLAENCLSMQPGDRPTLVKVHADISDWSDDVVGSTTDSSHERSSDSSLTTRKLHEVLNKVSTEEDQASWWKRKRGEPEKKVKSQSRPSPQTGGSNPPRQEGTLQSSSDAAHYTQELELAESSSDAAPQWRTIHNSNDPASMEEAEEVGQADTAAAPNGALQNSALAPQSSSPAAPQATVTM